MGVPHPPSPHRAGDEHISQKCQELLVLKPLAGAAGIIAWERQEAVARSQPCCLLKRKQMGKDGRNWTEIISLAVWVPQPVNGLCSQNLLLQLLGLLLSPAGLS